MVIQTKKHYAKQTYRYVKEGIGKVRDCSKSRQRSDQWNTSRETSRAFNQTHKKIESKNDKGGHRGTCASQSRPTGQQKI